MSEKTKGGIGELLTGLRVVARLNASGDFVRVDANPIAHVPVQEPFENGWGRNLRTRLMASMFLPPLFYALCRELSMKMQLVQVLTGMFCLFLLATTVPHMCRRFNFMSAHPDNECGSDDRLAGGIVVLLVCTGIGGFLSFLMHSALLAP